MSKKSRKRNKKILGILAAGLGAAALMKRKKRASIAGMDDAGINVTHPALTDPAPKTDWIKKKPKVIVPEIKPKIDHGMAYQSSRAAGNYPDHITAPTRVNGVAIKGRTYESPVPFHPSQGNRRRTMAQVLSGGDTRGWKKGGRVTGIAKRGFGRALMKGKK